MKTITLEQAKKAMESNGGSLDLEGTQITDNQAELAKVHWLRDGDCEEGRYIYCDGLLTLIKRTKRVRGYALYVGKIKGRNVVSDGELYAHCKTLREGIADIAYKRAVGRGAEQYRNVTLNTELTVEEAKAMYRVITGACRAGTEGFVQSLGELKEKYTVAEMIELTRGQYGAARFAEFFGR